MEGPLSLQDFPSVCRICLIGTNLRPFADQRLLDIFASITNIEIEPQYSPSKNICNNCLCKIEDILLLINESKLNHIGFLRDLVKQEEDELNSQLESEIIIIDDGTSVKVEENNEFDCLMKDILSPVCNKMNESRRGTKNKMGEETVRKRYTDIFPYVCRICVAKKNLGDFNEHKHLVDVFRNITNLAVSFEDRLPKNVCCECIQKLQNISDLIEMLKINNTKLHHISSSQQNRLCLEKSNKIKSSNIHSKINIEAQTKSDTNENMRSSINEEPENNARDHPNSDDQAYASTNIVEEQGQLNTCREGDNCNNSKKRLVILLKRDQIGKNGLTVWRQIRDEDFFSSVSNEKHVEANSVNNEKDHQINTLKVVLLREKWISDIASLLTHTQSGAQRRTKSDNFKNSFLNQHSPNEAPLHCRINADVQIYQCKMCTNTFKHKQSLSRHLDSHRSCKPFECRTCHKKFLRKKYLKCHMKIHTGERPFKCTICLQTFTQSASLSKHHHAIHLKERDFQCSICSKDFPTNYRLEVHIKTHSAEKKFNCSLCPKSFSLESYLRRHVKMHAPKDYVECHLCSKSISTGVYFRRHMKTHTVRDRKFKCAVCLKGFLDKGDQIKHMLIHRVERSFKCTICTAGFPVESYLKMHMQRCHLAREKSYQCTVCPKKFHHPSYLRSHLRKHKGDKQVKCEFCSKRFYHKSQMRIHLRVHTGEKPHSCMLCPKRFSHKTSLMIHLRTHTGEKPFECTECQRRFSKKSYLKIHMRIHTGERPYQCNICSRSFAHDNALKLHVRIHSKIKPFKCAECSKTFSASSDLTVHLRIHTGERPFKCTICPSSFSHRLTLQKHLIRHKGEKQYTCDTCFKSFVVKSDLACHIKSIHRQVESHCDICSRSFPKIGNLRKHMRKAHP